MKLYILGDSFTTRDYREWSWINALTVKYNVENFSYPGASNANIFAKFLEIYWSISSEDVVIISWSDINRNYDSQRTAGTRSLFEKYFFHETLHKLHDTSYLEHTKKIIKENNLRVLIVWAFPSEYKFNDIPTNWQHPEFNYIDYNTYKYSVNFYNEVKPALIHFSRLEIEKENVSRDAISAAYANDRRPNHIEDYKVHSELVKIVEEFIAGKISGQINLKQRLA